MVGEAEDGRKAIAAARHLRPDVVMLDLAMPWIGGLEALPLIQAVAPEAKIVVLSGLEPSTFEASAQRQGAFAYMPKGHDSDQLISALDALFAPTPKPSARTSASVPSVSEAIAGLRGLWGG